MQDILGGLQVLMDYEMLLYLCGGLVVGFVVGVLPGFDSANAAALFLPFSIGLPTETALILMGGIYAGASFAGCIPAILLNIPGTAGAAATTLDGFPMGQAGHGALAIGIGRMASTVGGTTAAIVVLLIIGPMSRFALNFRSPDMFMIAMIGLIIIGTVTGRDTLKGIISALLGLLIAAMSASPATGQPRFTAGFNEIFEQVPFVPIVIGMFAFSQVFIFAKEATEKRLRPTKQRRTGWASLRPDWLLRELKEAIEGVRITLRHKRLMARSALVGLGIGIIPGLGPAVGNFVSYGLAKRGSPHPEKFGTGIPEGIIASEGCDNAVAVSTMVPTLALGIPGSGMAAVMLAAIYLHGVQPGPRLLTTHSDEMYAFLLGLLLVSMLILPLGILLASPLTAVVRLRTEVLLPGILLISIVGAYALRSSLFDVGITMVFGILGFAMRQSGYPVVPLVLGVILGPIAEWNFMRSLRLSNGTFEIFFRSNTTRLLWAVFALVVFSSVRQMLAQRRGVSGPADESLVEGDDHEDERAAG